MKKSYSSISIASSRSSVTSSTSGFSYNGEKIGQGSENAKKYLADHPEIFDEIDHQVRVRFGLIDDDTAVVAQDEVAESPLLEEVTLDLDDAIEIEE